MSTDRRPSAAPPRATDPLAEQAKFRAMVELGSDVVVLVGADGTMLYVSPAMERLLGHPVVDVEGRRNLEFIHPDDHAMCEAALAELLTVPRRVVRLRYRAPHRDGTYHWMEGVATSLLDEPHVGAILVSVRDISEQRRAEDLLRESEARFALAVEGVKDGIWDWHLGAQSLFLSPRSRELLDLSADEPAGPNNFAERVHPDDQPHARERWQQHLESDQSHFEIEFRSRKAGGGYRWLLARVRTVRDAQARPARMAGSISDISARKHAEEESRQRQAELAHVLRVSAMDDMAASIAHELNQPLAAIVNYARGCTHRLDGLGVAPEVLEALDRIASEALRAGDIVRSLKRVVRKEPPGESSVDIGALAHEAAQLVRPDATERGIAVRLDITPSLPPVLADRVQIEQVMLNLLRNAVESITRHPLLIAVRAQATPSGGVSVAVSDTGIGIPAALMQRVFAPFFTTKTSGLGMGLSISRTIVESHGGRLWAEPNAGAGMTFSFTLPAERADPP